MMALYTEQNPFENFCDEKVCAGWRNIISNNIEVYINISEEDLDKELENPDSPIFLFYQSIGSGKIPEGYQEKIDEIKQDYSLLETHPYDTFIFDISGDTANKLKNDYGVEIYSENELDDYQECNIDEDFTKDEVYGCDRRIKLGWNKVLENFVHQNSNSTVIIDRNLFANENREGNLGVFNLTSYLNSVINDKLLIPYQVLIVTELSRNHGIELKREKLIKELVQKIESLRDFKIEIEILFVHPSMTTYEYTHQRRILKNYHFGTSELGFSIFYSNGKVRKDNDFSLQSSFIRYKKPIKLLKRLKEIKSNAERKLETQGQNDRFFRLYNGKDQAFKINNRLLN